MADLPPGLFDEAKWNRPKGWGQFPETNPHRSSGEGWTRVSKNSPCPICGKPDNCTVTNDGKFCYCGRVDEGASRTNAGGQYLHRLNDPHTSSKWNGGDYRKPIGNPNTPKGLPQSSPVQPSPTPNSKADPEPKIDWAAKAEGFRQHPRLRGKQIELAHSLGVSEASLNALGCGYDDSGKGSWTFPERDGNGKVIGISRRFRDGNKIAVPRSKRGIYFCEENLKLSGPVYIVEGASDTAAGITMGMRMIGRPSNNGGRHHIAVLLKRLLEKEPDLRVIVVGENDEKEDGKWPGREGAIRVAGSLTENLERPIEWGMPPEGVKDLRSWRNAIKGDPRDWGRMFLEQLELEVIEPPEITEPPRPTEPTVTVSEARKRLSNKIQNTTKPGVYLIDAQTGAGKTTAIMDAIAKRGGHSLVSAHTHRDTHEIARELKNRGVNAEAYPQRITEAKWGQMSENRHATAHINCWNPDADQAESHGLNVVDSVCFSCPHKDRCEQEGYLGGVAKAKKADSQIVTNARLARSGFLNWEKRGPKELESFYSLHAVEEEATNVVRPMQQITAAELKRAKEILAESRVNNPVVKKILESDEELRFFVESLFAMIDSLLEQIHSSDQTTEVVPRMSLAIPNGAQRLILEVIQGYISASGPGKVRPSAGQAWGWLMAFYEGLFSIISIVVTRPYGTASRQEPEFEKVIVGIRDNRPLPGICTFFSDATATIESIRQLVDMPVTPIQAGHLSLKKPVFQIPQNITQQTEGDSLRAKIRGVMAMYPERKSIGIILYSKHRGELDKRLGSELYDRICRVTHWRSGEDRSDNQWYKQCDLIIVCGTPYVPEVAIRERLLQLGLIYAASQPKPDWVEYKWRGQTVCGENLVVTTKGYVNEMWVRAFKEIIHAQIIQAVGRGRGTLDDGVEVVLLTKEPLCSEYKLVNMKPVTDGHLSAWMAVKELTAENAYNNPLGDSAVKSASTVTTKAVAKRLGLSPKRTRDILGELISLGLVSRVGEGKATAWRVSDNWSQPEEDGSSTSVNSVSGESSVRAYAVTPSAVVNGWLTWGLAV